jgi:hypothetical protein
MDLNIRPETLKLVLYANNELTEKEYMEKIPFIIASKKIRIEQETPWK